MMAAHGNKDYWRRWKHRLRSVFAPGGLLRDRYNSFRTILRLDGEALELLADLEGHLSGQDPADFHLIGRLSEQLTTIVGEMADQLSAMNPAYFPLTGVHGRLAREIRKLLVTRASSSAPPYVLPLEQAADHPELAGGKAANLSAAGRAGIVTPRGFVITANGFHRIVAENDLEGELALRFGQLHAADHATIIRIAGELQELILASRIPADMIEQIEQALQALGPVSLLAVRSSALAEDGKVSFAGQYASELEVEPGHIIAAYKRVIAGKYCPRAMSYRIRHGLSDSDTTMAALVIPMISPRVSGVMYTLDPAAGANGARLGIYAVEGLAEGLVDGSRTPEKYHLPRDERAWNVDPDGNLLSVDELERLRRWGLELEHHFGCPQDVEWALDESGLTVLQSRPLLQREDPPPVVVAAVDLKNLLCSNLHCAAPGISCGPVFHAPTGRNFIDIPPGSVVVTPTLRPSLSQFLDRIAGVVAENGSRASHFASVARERGVPVLVGGGIELNAGQIVTVDAASGRIFNGCVSSVLQAAVRGRDRDFKAEKYGPLTARTTRLDLLDPESSTFTPQHCRSLHDIVRFCHEKSVAEMFSLVGRKGRGLGASRKLETDLPLVMYVLDLENAAKSTGSGTIVLDEIASVPMRALWQGMAHPEIYWDTSQHHVDWEGFDRASGGIFSLDSRLLASYAIVAREYLHLNIRFGYHFSIVDTVCGELDSTNYINFRFKGGGAALHQRLFRLEFIEQVLGAFGFETSSRGDLLDAGFSRHGAAATGQALTRLGLLLAETRMMDMRMAGSEHAAEEAARFTAFGLKVISSQ
jgi:pyruvate,water dikinase